MKKAFHNCDVFAVLQEIVGRHVEHYQSDFEIDKEIIFEASESEVPYYPSLLWLARPCGTHCLYEADVFVQDTYPHNTWTFYGQQTRDPIIAYAIELAEPRFDGTIIGNLYELNYSDHYKYVQNKSLLRQKTTELHTPSIDIDKWPLVLDMARSERYNEKYKVFYSHNYMDAFASHYSAKSGGSAM